MKDTRNQKLDDLYRSYAKPLYYYLLKLTGSDSIAEELVQETFYRATVSLSFYDDENVKAWLFKVARNCYLDEWRKREKRKWIPFINSWSPNELLSPYGLPEEELLQLEKISDLNELLSKLPEQYRTILHLREFEQLTYEELGVALEISDSQVKIRLHRARLRLNELALKAGWEVLK